MDTHKNRMTDYVVVYGGTLDELQRNVNDKMTEGYHLRGGLFVAKGSYHQVLVGPTKTSYGAHELCDTDPDDFGFEGEH
jgi:hypothetical protein